MTIGWRGLVQRLLGSRPVKIAFVLAALALGVYAVVDQWAQVRAGLGRLGAGPVVGAFVAVLANEAAIMLSWRAVLAGLGSEVPLVPASRIFFVGQLGKYLPGSVWPALAQMELGHQRGVPRARSVTAFALTLVVSFASGLLVAGVLLPVADFGRYAWLLAIVPVSLAALHPRVVGPGLDKLLRLVRRPPLEHRPDAATLAVSAAWAIAGWAAFGLQTYVLATALGAPAGRAALPAFGGYALAWCAGLVVVFAPAGAGVREVVLVAALVGVLPRGDGTLLALLSRVLVTAADVLCAALAGAGAARRELGAVTAGAGLER